MGGLDSSSINRILNLLSMQEVWAASWFTPESMWYISVWFKQTTQQSKPLVQVGGGSNCSSIQTRCFKRNYYILATCRSSRPHLFRKMWFIQMI
jgi:hypothetical protein